MPSWAAVPPSRERCGRLSAMRADPNPTVTFSPSCVPLCTVSAMLSVWDAGGRRREIGGPCCRSHPPLKELASARYVSVSVAHRRRFKTVIRVSWRKRGAGSDGVVRPIILPSRGKDLGSNPGRSTSHPSAPGIVHALKQRGQHHGKKQPDSPEAEGRSRPSIV